MDGRSDEDDADGSERRRAAGSSVGTRGSGDETGSTGTERTGWPYEPDVNVGDETGSMAGAESSLEDTSDSEVASVFWRVVLLVDVALLGLTIGPLLIVVRDSPGRGFGLFALGLVALGYAYHIYRDYRDGDDAGENDGTEEIDEDPGGAPAEPERNG